MFRRSDSVRILLLFCVLAFTALLRVGAQAAELPFPNSAFAEVNGLSLHHRTWEPNEGPIRGGFMLVHGLGGSTFSWRYTAPFLAEQGYFVAAVDLPGFGYSDRSRGIDHSQQSRAELLWLLAGQLEAAYGFQPDGGWHLLGHSMGGGTITAMAHQQPGAAAGLVYAAGAVYNRPPGTAAFIFNIPVLDHVIAWFFRLIFLRKTRIERVLESAYGRPPTAAEISGYLEPLLLPATEYMFLDITTSQGDPVAAYLAEIDMPVLLLWGGQDTWVPPEQGQQLNQDIGHSVLVIKPESGHCPMETDPGWFNEQLLLFLGH